MTPITRQIDTTYDFRTDANGGDPDRTSKTLQNYHQLLWSKLLPNGQIFDLQKRSSGQLYHSSRLGQFILSSDSFIPTFSRRTRYQHIIKQVPQSDIDEFMHLGYTIGGMIIFPCNKVESLQTINVARGFNTKIGDRMDLTLECIRRYYLGQDSPLYKNLAGYNGFFSLFGGFQGYVDFFLLQDMVSSNYQSINFFHPFDNFTSSPYPTTVEEYVQYKSKNLAFLQGRNQRIDNWQSRINP